MSGVGVLESGAAVGKGFEIEMSWSVDPKGPGTSPPNYCSSCPPLYGTTAVVMEPALGEKYPPPAAVPTPPQMACWTRI